MRDAPRPNGSEGSLEKQKRDRARRMLTVLILFAIVMFFSGLVSAYVVSMSAGYWVRIAMPMPFYVSTALILAGSITIQLALASAKRGNAGRVPALIGLTLALGIGFAAFQFKGWSELVARGITLNPNKMLDLAGEYGTDFSFIKDGKPLVKVGEDFYLPDDPGHARPLNAELEEQKDRTGPYFYALTLLHMAHLAFGLLALMVMLWVAFRGGYTAHDHVGLWSGTLYWHFLGGLWVFLLVFLMLGH